MLRVVWSLVLLVFLSGQVYSSEVSTSDWNLVDQSLSNLELLMLTTEKQIQTLEEKLQVLSKQIESEKNDSKASRLSLVNLESYQAKLLLEYQNLLNYSKSLKLRLAESEQLSNIKTYVIVGLGVAAVVEALILIFGQKLSK